MKKNNRVGEKYVTNEGHEVKIIEYFGKENCSIEFRCGLVLKNRKFIAVKRGSIKYPYHKSVYGIGYIGVGLYCEKNNRNMYNTWGQMIRRCYSEGYQPKAPTYIGCSVHSDWHNFQVFASFYELKYREGFHLDKDILVKGNKVYGPDTCCFVPQEINVLFTKLINRGNWPVGVTYSVLNKNYTSRLSKGDKVLQRCGYITPEDAFYAYKKDKEEHIKEQADKWRNEIDPRVYEAMCSREIEITD